MSGRNEIMVASFDVSTGTLLTCPVYPVSRCGPPSYCAVYEAMDEPTIERHQTLLRWRARPLAAPTPARAHAHKLISAIFPSAHGRRGRRGISLSYEDDHSNALLRCLGSFFNPESSRPGDLSPFRSFAILTYEIQQVTVRSSVI
jgi:hypothetical protein